MALKFREFRQSEAAECGLVCLAISSGLLGSQVSLAELRRRHPVSIRGLTLKDVADIAGAMRMEGRALKCGVDELPQLNTPAILHWGMNHFVVLERADRKGCHIIDPARGPRLVSGEEVNREFTGIALEIATTPAFEKKHESSPLNLLSLVRWAPWMWSGLSQVLLLSILLQAYMVVSPFYIQLALDQGAARGDKDFLLSLAIGFGLFAAFNAVASGLRGVALQHLSATLSWDMTRRVFHHMIRLPLPWFHRRRLADALTRFEAIEPIRDLIASGFVAVVIDGILSITMIVMMFVFYPPLAWITLASVVVYVAISILSLPASIRLGMASLSAMIAEQSKRIETLRGMQTIKVMASEAEREGDWANRFAEAVRTRQSSALLSVLTTTLQQFVEATSLVTIVYFGVSAILSTDITVGILYAFLAYRTQFTTSAQALVNQFVLWRMLDIHTFRLADIVLHPPEKGIERSSAGTPDIKGAFELSNVGFTYAPHERPVLRGINLRVQSGEFVAISGPSGSGKTTLLKVMMGLYPATAGDVRIDGLPLSAWSPAGLRRSFGVVMQDDELFSGSIADNVAFFDEHIDMDRVWRALKLASIDEEVAAMPMRTETLIGDMGSAFSGGQKQRLILARAFYRAPRVLLLDEATSHIDVARERSINESLKQQRITRIVSAHRPETLAAADRVLTLVNGTITSDRRRAEFGSTAGYAAP